MPTSFRLLLFNLGPPNAPSVAYSISLPSFKCLAELVVQLELVCSMPIGLLLPKGNQFQMPAKQQKPVGRVLVYCHRYRSSLNSELNRLTPLSP